MVPLLLASALLSSPSLSSSSANPSAPTAAVVRHGPPPPRVTGNHASVPLEFVGGLPAFHAAIGGKPFVLGFDTGAGGGAHLTDGIVAALGLQPVGEALAGDPSGKNLVRVKLYPIADLAIGRLKISDWIGTSEPAIGGKLAPIDGIIGLGAFDGFVVTLDFAHKRLQLDRGELPPANGRTIFDYQGRSIPMVPVTIEGMTLDAHLDTGNVSMPLIVPQEAASKLAGINQARAVGTAHTLNNSVEMKAVPVAGPVLIGKVPIAAKEAAFPSIIDIANIGSLALQGIIVKIDPKNHRVELSPPKTPSVS